MLIDEAVRIFSKFLNSSWDIVKPLLINRNYAANNNSIYDWLQANWEILVECKVLNPGDSFEVYGEGADFYGASSRITDIHSIPNHSIIIKGKEKEVLDILNDKYFDPTNLRFEELVGFENNYYVYKPPFDFVLAKDKFNRERVFHLKDIEFEIKKM